MFFYITNNGTPFKLVHFVTIIEIQRERHQRVRLIFNKLYFDVSV